MWSTTAPLGRRLREAIAYRGAVSDTDLADNHYRIVGGDRLMWSGGIDDLGARSEAVRRRLRPISRDSIRSSARSRSNMPGPARSATRCIACRRSASFRPAFGWRAASAATGSTPRRWRAISLARAIVEGDETWRLFAPFELVWAGGCSAAPPCRSTTGGSTPASGSRRKQARQREEEYRRGQELAALRAGEERPQAEEKVGAVVPAEELPQEPTLAELPVDTVIAGEAVHAVPTIDESESADAYAEDDQQRRG